MKQQLDNLTIERRFHGPPESGNGGYVCGLLAAHVSRPARVRLLAPPPLDTPMGVKKTDGGVELRHGEQLIARAWTEPFTLALPVSPPPELARSAARHFAGLHEHAFPTCFVCGPERAAGDGLRIFPGPTGVAGQVACTWRPDPDLADEQGVLRPEFLWAALDCPSGWAHLHANGSPAVLGEFSLQQDGVVRAGEQYIVLGWQTGAEGRKLYSASALFTPAGAPLACAIATWIRLLPAT